MTTLGPRIGEQQKDPGNARGWQRRNKEPRVVLKEPYIDQLAAVPLRNESGNAIDVGLTADKSAFGMGRRLCCEMLTGAKADFQPDLICRYIEQSCTVDKFVAASREAYFEIKHMAGEQVTLMGPQSMPAPPAVEISSWVLGRIAGHVAVS